ncbi:hypothetical protein XENOCAPTIV_010148 [Xenoophorus captivus]|uniref:Uncharacterized protein n=1 Tax=Xenoophorus captivus TaxID=1517983 RepID=A0ABV0RQ91_9TELE
MPEDALRCTYQVLNVQDQHMFTISESSQKASFKGSCLDPSEPESEVLPSLPEHCNDFIPVLPSATELYVEPETSPVYCLKNKISTTESDNLDGVEVPATLLDLYIFESDTQDFIPPHIANPHKITGPEHQPISQSGEGKADHERDAHVPMCYSEGIETHCQSGFREERASENVSEANQREELRATAADAWEVDWMSENNVRSGKAEVTAMTLQRQHSNSPAELWLDACQYLTGEHAEDKEVWDHQALGNSLQESDYNPSDSRRIGWSPVKRWSSVDSWASALSDWTGIIEEPPEDITAAFTEIGAEIDALTQALQEVTSHLEPETLQEDPRATAVEEKQQTMHVPLKTPDISESSIPSELSCLFLFETSRPELCDRGRSWRVESHKCGGELELQDLQSSQAESCPNSALQNISASSSSVKADSSDPIEVTPNAGTVSSGCSDLPQFDRYLKSCAQDLFSSEEDHAIALKITEDVDLTTQRELRLEEEDKGQTDLCVFSAHVHKTLNEPGVDTQTDPQINVSFKTFPDSVGASQVEPDSQELIMCLAPLSGDSALVCRTSSSLEGDQTCTKTCLSDRISCGHVQDCTSFPTLGGITNKQFLEGHEELIHKKQNIINTAEKLSPDELLELQADETVWPFLSVTEEINDLSRDLARFSVFPGDHLFISEKDAVACITLDVNDPFIPWISEPIFTAARSEQDQPKMAHKANKNISDSKTRSKKEKSVGHHHCTQAPKKQDSTSQHVSNQQTRKQQECHSATGENHVIENNEAGLEAKEAKLVMETSVGTEKGTGRPHGKKKKKHGHKTTVKHEVKASVDLEYGTKPKTPNGKVDMLEAKPELKAGKAQLDANQSLVAETKTQQPEDNVPQRALHVSDHKELTTEVIKKRRVSGDKFGKILSVLESKLPKADASLKAKVEETQTEITAAQKKAYSEVVKQKIPTKEGEGAHQAL